MRFSVLVISWLACWLISTAAYAADPSEAELAQRRQEAKERYDKGVEAYQEGRHKDAIDLFLEADTLAPSSALSFNIARAYEKIKDSSNALRWYRDYLRREPQAEDKEKVLEFVKQYEALLAEKGVQQVTVLSDPEAATVRVDGRPVGVTPWTADLPPGEHTILLSLRGYADTQRTIVLEPDRAQDVHFRLVPASPTPAAQPAAAAPVETPSQSVVARDRGEAPTPKGVALTTYVVLGAGALTLGAAGGFELARRSAESDAEGASQIEYAEALDTVDRHQTTARILAGVGGALLVAGGVLLALDLTRAPAETVSSERRLRGSLSAVALCSRATCGAMLHGRF